MLKKFGLGFLLLATFCAQDTAVAGLTEQAGILEKLDSYFCLKKDVDKSKGGSFGFNMDLLKLNHELRGELGADERDSALWLAFRKMCGEHKVEIEIADDYGVGQGYGGKRYGGLQLRLIFGYMIEAESRLDEVKKVELKDFLLEKTQQGKDLLFGKLKPLLTDKEIWEEEDQATLKTVEGVTLPLAKFWRHIKTAAFWWAKTDDNGNFLVVDGVPDVDDFKAVAETLIGDVDRALETGGLPERLSGLTTKACQTDAVFGGAQVFCALPAGGADPCGGGAPRDVAVCDVGAQADDEERPPAGDGFDVVAFAFGRQFGRALLASSHEHELGVSRGVFRAKDLAGLELDDDGAFEERFKDAVECSPVSGHGCHHADGALGAELAEKLRVRSNAVVFCEKEKEWARRLLADPGIARCARLYPAKFERGAMHEILALRGNPGLGLFDEDGDQVVAFSCSAGDKKIDDLAARAAGRLTLFFADLDLKASGAVGLGLRAGGFGGDQADGWMPQAVHESPLEGAVAGPCGGGAPRDVAVCDVGAQADDEERPPVLASASVQTDEEAVAEQDDGGGAPAKPKADDGDHGKARGSDPAAPRDGRKAKPFFGFRGPGTRGVLSVGAVACALACGRQLFMGKAEFDALPEKEKAQLKRRRMYFMTAFGLLAGGLVVSFAAPRGKLRIGF